MKIRDEVWKTWQLPPQGTDLWEWQDGRCAWCGYDREGLVRDHCHMTGLIRGLLCKGCNTKEGVTSGNHWDAWRDGDNPANAIGHYEIYRNHLGATSISPQSALSFYSPVERAAWYELVVARLADGSIKWPLDAPWIDTALQRKADADAQMHAALDSMFSGPEWDGLFARKAAATEDGVAS